MIKWFYNPAFQIWYYIFIEKLDDIYNIYRSGICKAISISDNSFKIGVFR